MEKNASDAAKTVLAVLSKANRKVNIVTESKFTFPQLFMEVYFVGDEEDEPLIAEMFVQAGCAKARTLAEADLVVFGGGIDVNPALYNEKPHPSVSFSTVRDRNDMEMFYHCLEHGIPMMGICRGAQFLSVMHGGKLYQHVDNHNGDHSIVDVFSGLTLPCVSSVHHQMVIPFSDMVTLATSKKANTRYTSALCKVEGDIADVEAYVFPDTATIGFQGHPEYRGYEEFTQWCLACVNEMIDKHPSIELRDNVYRLTKEWRNERSNKWRAEGKTLPGPARLLKMEELN